jgi:glycosyl transferase, family 25
MHAFIINLDCATERWRFVEGNFAATGIPFTRISAVDGRKLTLPIPEYDEARYRRRTGQRNNPGAIGCFLSHIKAMHAFLESPADIGIVTEDDIVAVPNLRQVVESALAYQDTWDILRLAGFHNPHPVAYAELPGGFKVSVCFTQLCGTGAYALTRHATEVLVKRLLPMTIPIDHALDREWAYGLRQAAIIPLPVSQNDARLGSDIATHSENQKYKLPFYRRCWTVPSWRVCNETSRLYHRLCQLHRIRRLMARRTQP